MRIVSLFFISMFLLFGAVFSESKLRVTESGEVGVNNDEPEEKLDVKGNIKTNRIRLRNLLTNDTPLAGDFIWDGNDFLGFDGTFWRSLTQGGIQGLQGPEGPMGPQGVQGETGPQGLPGASGDQWVFDFGEPVDAKIEAFNVIYFDRSSGNVHLKTSGNQFYEWMANFGGNNGIGPQGPMGPKGEPGKSISISSTNTDIYGNVRLNFSDNTQTEINFPGFSGTNPIKIGITPVGNKDVEIGGNLNVGGALTQNYLNLSSNTTIPDDVNFVFVDSSARSVVLKLPESEKNAGKLLSIIKTSPENLVTVKTSGNDIVNSGNFVSISNPYIKAELISNRDQWFFLNPQPGIVLTSSAEPFNINGINVFWSDNIISLGANVDNPDLYDFSWAYQGQIISEVPQVSLGTSTGTFQDNIVLTVTNKQDSSFSEEMAFELPLVFQPNRIRQVEAGSTDTLILYGNGELMGSGKFNRQFNNRSSSEYQAIYNDINIHKIITGDDRTFLLMDNGSVKATGYNYYGEIGFGHESVVSYPQELFSSNIQDIFPGFHCTFFLKEDGSLWAVGRNSFNQIGYGLSSHINSPEEIFSDNVIKVSSYITNSLFLMKDGSVLAAGWKYPSLTEVFSEDIIDITTSYHNSSSEFFNLFVDHNGNVYANGKNRYGQFGNGTTSDSDSPTLVFSGNVKKVFAGLGYSFLLTEEGKVLASGLNSSYQLGDGTNIDRTDWTEVISGNIVHLDVSKAGHQVALSDNGSMYSWGLNTSGQLGIDIIDANLSTFTETGVTSVAKILAGPQSSLIIKEDGSLWGTGSLESREGNNAGLYQNTFRHLSGNILSVSTSSQNNALMVFPDNSLRVFDYYSGNIQIAVPGNVIAAGGSLNSMLYLKNDGSLWAKGYNHNGKFGLGNDDTQSDFVKIVSGNVKSFLSDSITFIIKEDNSLWGCGYNSYGQLGLGDKENRNTFQEILSGNISQIDSGTFHTLALKDDGSVWAWGHNGSGQLGNGGYTESLTPQKIIESGVIDISAGSRHSMIVKDDGSLWAWGNQHLGQLGDGTTSGYSTSPKLIISNGVKKVSCWGRTSIVLMEDGRILVTGENRVGQLGIGTDEISLNVIKTPTLIDPKN